MRYEPIYDPLSSAEARAMRHARDYELTCHHVEEERLLRRRPSPPPPEPDPELDREPSGS